MRTFTNNNNATTIFAVGNNSNATINDYLTTGVINAINNSSTTGSVITAHINNSDAAIFAVNIGTGSAISATSNGGVAITATSNNSNGYTISATNNNTGPVIYAFGTSTASMVAFTNSGTGYVLDIDASNSGNGIIINNISSTAILINSGNINFASGSSGINFNAGNINFASGSSGINFNAGNINFNSGSGGIIFNSGSGGINFNANATGIYLPTPGMTQSLLNYYTEYTASFVMTGATSSKNVTFYFTRIGRIVTVSWPQISWVGGSNDFLYFNLSSGAIFPAALLPDISANNDFYITVNDGGMVTGGFQFPINGSGNTISISGLNFQKFGGVAGVNYLVYKGSVSYTATL